MPQFVTSATYDEFKRYNLYKKIK